MEYKAVLIKISSAPSHIANSITLKRKKVICGTNLHINGTLKVHGSGKIIIGDNVSINSSPDVNPVAGGNETHLRAEGDGVLKIGNNVGISYL